MYISQKLFLDAYLKSKSTETALHVIIRTIEGSLENKHYTMAVFLNIEGSFNNVSTDAIQRALIDLEMVEVFESNYPDLYAKIIKSYMGNISITKKSITRSVISTTLVMCYQQNLNKT